MRTLVLFAAIALMTGTITPASAQDGHEYAPIQQATISYKNWQLPALDQGVEAVDLRQWSKGKKLVLVVYFAPWCGNWRFEAPVVARLYDKYKAHGFDVVAVSEYAAADETRSFMKEAGAGYTVVVESQARDARDKTSHFGYRTATGDSRNWGSPYNVFLEPKRLEKKGDVLTSKAWVVNGELVEAEADAFIRERLGLKAEKTELKGGR